MIITNDIVAADHRTPAGHPERAARMAAVMDALSEGPLVGFARREAQPARRSALLRAHSQDHVAFIEAAAERAMTGQRAVALDPDTWVSAGSLDAALRAAGGATDAVDAVANHETEKVFVACRPPGHHAEYGRAMGFCLFSNIAVGAKHALDGCGLGRVAVLDFDVHHGNGTQAILDRDERCFFASSHQSPLFPGTGANPDLNRPDLVNMPLAAGFDGVDFRNAWEMKALPALDAFKPDLILVSAGFDAHARDPLAQGNLQADHFAWIGHAVREVAQGSARGRVVACLEGGYDLQGLGEGVQAFVSALLTGAAN